jgi:hypothetical protein
VFKNTNAGGKGIVDPDAPKARQPNLAAKRVSDTQKSVSSGDWVDPVNPNYKPKDPAAATATPASTAATTPATPATPAAKPEEPSLDFEGILKKLRGSIEENPLTAAGLATAGGYMARNMFSDDRSYPPPMPLDGYPAYY